MTFFLLFHFLFRAKRHSSRTTTPPSKLRLVLFVSVVYAGICASSVTGLPPLRLQIGCSANTSKPALLAIPSVNRSS